MFRVDLPIHDNPSAWAPYSGDPNLDQADIQTTIGLNQSIPLQKSNAGGGGLTLPNLNLDHKDKVAKMGVAGHRTDM